LRRADAGRRAPPRESAERLNEALNHTTGPVRDIADALVVRAESGLHQWLNLTLLAGAALAGLGVLVAITGALLKKS
jgi:hypothetical protein